jgi:hypothetical protein
MKWFFFELVNLELFDTILTFHSKIKWYYSVWFLVMVGRWRWLLLKWCIESVGNVWIFLGQILVLFTQNYSEMVKSLKSTYLKDTRIQMLFDDILGLRNYVNNLFIWDRISQTQCSPSLCKWMILNGILSCVNLLVM